MKFTDTKTKVAEKEKQEYINNAPLMEKKKQFTNISVQMNGQEKAMLDAFLESQVNATGRKASRSQFVRNAVMNAIRNDIEPTSDEWLDEPFTVPEAAAAFNIPEPTIHSAITEQRFLKNEVKKITVKNREIWLVTRRGMERLYNSRVK